jgi:threonine dehydrogenase-like Zn-dependent dehydrogenase
MKALVLKGVGNIALEEVADPVIKDSTDAIVKITMTTICGTDLHSVRGTMPGYKPGTVLGHEGVGIVEQIGANVRTIKVGDRVIMLSTIGCGQCKYCKKGDYSQCDNANPLGPNAGTVFYGGPLEAGGLNGMQAQKVRVPFADVSLIKVPDSLSDLQVILLSDILPTSYMAVENASPIPEDMVAVFGCGPVGQLAIACLKIVGVKKIFAIDRVPSRLAMAESQGAHAINFDEVDPVKELKRLTDDHGPSKIIDAVGIDAQHPHTLSNWFKSLVSPVDFKQEVKTVAPITNPHDGNWIPGNAPSQVLRWAVQAIEKTGIISIIGVYTPLLEVFPLGAAMEKNVTVTMGNCNHRAYFPLLLDWVQEEKIDLVPFMTQTMPFDEIVEAYKHFDKRDDGWLKIALLVA